MHDLIVQIFLSIVVAATTAAVKFIGNLLLQHLSPKFHRLRDRLRKRGERSKLESSKTRQIENKQSSSEIL